MAAVFDGPIERQRADGDDDAVRPPGLPHFDGRPHRGFGDKRKQHIDLAGEAVVKQEYFASPIIGVVERQRVIGERIVDIGAGQMLLQ